MYAVSEYISSFKREVLSSACVNMCVHMYTVQKLNSCTSRPDACQCLLVQTPMDNMSKGSSRIKATFSCEVRDPWSHPCEESWEAIRCAVVYMPGLPTHLVQKLNTGTVLSSFTCEQTCQFARRKGLQISTDVVTMRSFE